VAGQTQTVSNVIADQADSGGSGGHAGTYSLGKIGGHADVVRHEHVFGDTTINTGTLAVGANTNFGVTALGLAFGGGTLPGRNS
jgi:hypothetical protein